MAVDGDAKVGMVFGELVGGEVNVRIWIHPSTARRGTERPHCASRGPELAAAFPAVPLVVRAPGVI